MRYTEKQVKVPLCAVSTTSSLENKTGIWRFAQPIFIDRVSPCNMQCPAGEDITGYMYLVSKGRYEEAWRLIMEENPFPAIMGRVCFHICEERCNRAEHDEAVSIHMVERFIGDYGLSHSLKIAVPKPEKDKRVAIVGAGPAGLSAAYHLRKMGYNVTLFDYNPEPGGIMRYGIPAYRLPKEILDGEIGRLYDIEIEFKMGVRVGEDISWEALDKQFKAVFIAIGAWEDIGLRIKGLDRKGIFNALEFLKEVNLGKKPKIGKVVAVIGGGNSAIDCARVSRRLGSEVTIIYRRGEAEMPAHPEEIEMAREEGIRFLLLASPIEVRGGEMVSGLNLEEMTLGEVDQSGRRRPMPTGKAFDIDCDTMIIAIGEATRLDDLPPSISHRGGVVEADQIGQTIHPRFFAGGDIIDIPHTVTHAIGSGKRSAVAIDRFLGGIKGEEDYLDQFRWGDSGNISLAWLKGTSPFPRKNPALETTDYRDMNPFYFDHRAGMKIRRIHLKGFQEVIESPSQEEVVSETMRCFNCGACTECGNCYIFCPENCIRRDPGGYGYIADMDYCKGCGVCVHECPRGAMSMKFME
ncbi:MAG: FAD-dependent oxidoreductase [Deltaproteobacteria bacterium]|nr:MAG: FAD-dependent oxidoreductase [Deltaproteobacteria bacterium]